jgi:hypothetical protein
LFGVVALDLGYVSLGLQVLIFFLLILGLPLVRGAGNKKNLMRHGYLTVLALILHVSLTIILMIPTIDSGFGALNGLSFLDSLTVWSHVILGTAAIILGFIIVGFWLSKPLSNMACLRAKKIMLPLLIIWTISLINGAIIHIFGIL